MDPLAHGGASFPTDTGSWSSRCISTASRRQSQKPACVQNLRPPCCGVIARVPWQKKRIMTKKVYYGQCYKVPLIITQTHLFKALSHHCSLCAEPQLQRRSDFAFFAKILPYLSLKTILVLVTSACENHRLERHECLKFFFFPLKCIHCNRYCKGSFVCLWIKAGFRH